MGKRRSGSLKFQVFEKVDSMKCFGQKKHSAKQAEKERCKILGIRWNPSRIPGKIFSWRTADIVKEKGLNFVAWEKENHPEMKILKEIHREHVGEYLQLRIDKGLSSWTIRQDASALAKLFDCESKDFGVEIPMRRLQDIIKNTGPVKDFNYKKWADLVNLGKACGMRRESADVLGPQNFFIQNGILMVHLVEKGGKARNVPIRLEYREWILAFIGKRKGQLMVEHYPNRTPWHRFRQDYAAGLYKEIEARLDRTHPNRKKELYRCRDGRIFECDILLEVSFALGHNRIDVVASNYLR